MSSSNKHRISIDFKDRDSMVRWFSGFRLGVVEERLEDSALYTLDSLDEVAHENHFVVKREGDRDERFRLTLTETTTKKV